MFPTRGGLDSLQLHHSRELPCAVGISERPLDSGMVCREIDHYAEVACPDNAHPFSARLPNACSVLGSLPAEAPGLGGKPDSL